MGVSAQICSIQNPKGVSRMSTTQSSKSRLIMVLCATALFSLVGIGCSSDDLPGVDTSTYYGLGSDPSNVPIQINLEGQSFQRGDIRSVARQYLRGLVERHHHPRGRGADRRGRVLRHRFECVLFEDSQSESWSFFGTAPELSLRICATHPMDSVRSSCSSARPLRPSRSTAARDRAPRVAAEASESTS